MATSMAANELLSVGNRAKIARLCGLTKSHVRKVLSGNCGVTLESAARIAKAAGVTLDELWRYIEEIHEERAA